MMECDYKKNNSLAIYRAVVSIVLGIAVGAASFFGLIANPITLVAIILSVAIVAVGWILISLLIDNSVRNNRGDCFGGIANEARDSLIGAIGSIITGTIALTAGIVAASVLSAILVGLTAVFGIFLITRIYNLINKLIREVSND